MSSQVDSMDLAEVTKEKPVLVTGFGPFHHHSVNASWVAVQELHKVGVEHKSKPVRLEIREIPVAYQVVSSTLPEIYKELDPKLCVHVGVAPYSVIKIEKYGKNHGYRGPDIHGCAPSAKMCVPGGPDVIPSKFNIETVCESVCKKHSDIVCQMSTDAGRYLCDFIYYTSLYLDKAPTVFVHVPAIDSPYSVEQLARALKEIVETLLQELD